MKDAMFFFKLISYAIVSLGSFSLGVNTDYQILSLLVILIGCSLFMITTIVTEREESEEYIKELRKNSKKRADECENLQIIITTKK